MTRKALLAENYSHIYDRKFDWENRDKIAMVQARVRCFLAYRRFQEHLRKQREHD